jgi:hypothetical protein
LRPAFAAVGRAGEIGAGLVAAMHHHHRIGMQEALRDHVLDVHLPNHRAALDRWIDLAADEEIARLGQHQRAALLRARGRDEEGAEEEHTL